MDNSHFIVSARKYRPSTFSAVVGQKNLTATLQNAIVTNRLAHAYLFCGSRGVGKTSCARIFAKTINCEHPTPEGDPCNQCSSCQSFNEGRSLNIIEMDAASNNGVDEMRKLTEQVLVPPTTGKYRIFIIDEVHMLSSQAFNAFLKTLEEPPSYVIFILATTEKHKIIPTILSRCQIYDFNRITTRDIVDHLASVAKSEGYEAEREALAVIASKSDGALRDALSIFDQVAASSRGKITYKSAIDNLNVLDEEYYNKLAETFHNSDIGNALLIFNEIRDKGFDIHFFINGLQSYLRNLMVAKDPRTLPLLDVTDEQKKKLAELASKFSNEFFYMAMSLVNDADLKYREATNKAFLAELLLIKLCQLLSPSPVFKGKEEGHLENLSPIEAVVVKTATVTKTESKPVKEIALPRPVTPSQQSKSPMPKVKSIRTSDKTTETQPVSVTVQDTSSPKPAINKEFSEDDVKGAIREFVESSPEKKMLVNTLGSAFSKLVKLGDNNFRIDFIVQNPIQKELIEKEETFLQFLKIKLGLPQLDISVFMNEGDVPSNAWSEKEVYEHMLEKYPQMSAFINDLQLSLG